MTTLTLTRRYGVPAFLAAALHAVLFVAIVPKPHEVIIPLPTELPKLPTFPPELRQLFVTPPEPQVVDQSVKPLPGGAPRPVSDETFLSRDDGIVITVTTTVVPRPNVPVDFVPNAPMGPGGTGEALWSDGAPTMVGVDVLDRTPRALAQASPEYPFALRQSGIEGEVVIEFDVDITGRVVTARVLRGGEREFEQSALRAVLRWRFEPGRRDGRVVPFRMAVPITFRVNED